MTKQPKPIDYTRQIFWGVFLIINSIWMTQLEKIGLLRGSLTILGLVGSVTLFAYYTWRNATQ